MDHLPPRHQAVPMFSYQFRSRADAVDDPELIRKHRDQDETRVTPPAARGFGQLIAKESQLGLVWRLLIRQMSILTIWRSCKWHPGRYLKPEGRTGTDDGAP